MNEASLKETIESLKGIGDKTAKVFEKAGIVRIEDLLEYYPRNYDTFEDVVKVSDLKSGNTVAVRCQIIGNIYAKNIRNMSIITFDIGDITGKAKVTYFNQPYLRSTLKQGHYYIFRGLVTRKGNTFCFNQPKIYQPEDYFALQGTMQPIYPLVKGLSNNMVVKAMQQAMESAVYMKDPLPSYLIEDNNLMEYRDAIKNIHFPEDKHTFDIARRRLSYNEFLFFILRLRILKLTEEESVSTAVMKKSELVDRFLEKLPYDLTDAQKRVYKEIEADLTGSRVMNRLIQGDVGSGKTILAFLALLITVENGYQGAMMAPTEVLARQHYEDICNMAKEYDLPFRPVLMIGSLKAKEKKENKKGIEDGTYNVCIGTNALIQDTVNYKNLALVITDEQHRFGVRQREKFAGKGECTHVLAMSATPIPRTLAIILYGDLHVSVVDEKPASRLPIKNCVVGPDYRPTAYRFIEKQVSLGHQVYVICPMIEEGEMNDVENVTDYTEKLRKELSPSIHVDMLNGRMKASEKDELMEKFANKEIDVLVSTTVIEVGINVPNATVMMIENAEHFGLAQLHQLRGRVGRGKDQSYCIFMNTSESKDAAARLDILGKSNDGFKIAEEDLKQRGPGDMFGIRQSGDLFFKIGDIYADSDLIKKASIDADRILGDDPDLCKKENEALHKALAGANETIVL